MCDPHHDNRNIDTNIVNKIHQTSRWLESSPPTHFPPPPIFSIPKFHIFTITDNPPPLNTTSSPMYVIKRNGESEQIFYDKIQTRINSLTSNLDTNYVDIARISQKVISGLYPGVKTRDLDNLAAETSAYMSTIHPDYARLAARISVSNLQKETDASFSKTMSILSKQTDPNSGKFAGFIKPSLMEVIDKYGDIIDEKVGFDIFIFILI